MRIIACAVLLCGAVSGFAQEPLKHDFRGAKFDRDVLNYSGLTPDKYLTPEDEGLRLRYTGANAPPTNNTAGIAWRFHARGNFVVTAKYEILKIEPPTKGWGVGAELYLRLKNPNKDGIAFARSLRPGGESMVTFQYMTNNEAGRRGPKDSKHVPTNERSLRGAFRLAREGTVLVASFAEADDEFKEIQRTDIGTADVDLIRFAGVAGGDTNAVLDMRMLEFNLQGRDLGYNGRDFVTAPPKPAVPGAVPIVQPVDPAPQPAAEAAPGGRRNLLLLVGIFFAVLVPLLLIGGTVLFVRMRNRE